MSLVDYTSDDNYNLLVLAAEKYESILNTEKWGSIEITKSFQFVFKEISPILYHF